MADLSTQPAELRMTLQIVRAATGKTETVELVGHVIPEPEAKEDNNVSNPQHSSP